MLNALHSMEKHSMQKTKIEIVLLTSDKLVDCNMSDKLYCSIIFHVFLPNTLQQTLSSLSTEILSKLCLNFLLIAQRSPGQCGSVCWSIVLNTKKSHIQFPVRSHAWVLVWSSVGVYLKGNQWMFLSLSLPSPLSKVN